MRRSLARAGLALFAVLGWLVACAAPDRPGPDAGTDACRPRLRAEAPLLQARNFLVVPAVLDSRPTALLVDTGAETTTLTPEVAAALHLRRDKVHQRLLTGITGDVRAASLLLPTLTLGSIVVTRQQSVSVGDLPSLETLQPPVSGLLGADVLARYDVELDLPAGRLALYDPSPCPGYRPWHRAESVAFERSSGGLAILDAHVDGRAVRALLDTGARTSLMTQRMAETLGVTPAMLAADESRTGVGVGGSIAVFRQHTFGSFGLPGAIVRDVPVNVADLRLPDVELLLGADYLGSRHLWISYAARRLYLR